jgi:hypothetical protein
MAASYGLGWAVQLTPGRHLGYIGPAMATGSPPSAPPRCPCGFDRHHGLVRPEPKYGLGGTLALVFAGAGARPKRIDYRCQRCNTVIESVTDPAVLRAFH